jgi:hypothetical protein
MNEPLRLTATVSPSYISQEVRWSSNKPDVAVVNHITGVIQTIAPGDAVIIARSVVDDTVRDTIDLKILSTVPTSIEIINKPPIYRNEHILAISNEPWRLGIIEEPAGTDKRVIWSVTPLSGNATIDSDGRFSPISSGRVLIRATSIIDPSKYDTLFVRIAEPGIDYIFHTEGYYKNDITIRFGNGMTPENITNAEAAMKAWTDSHEKLSITKCNNSNNVIHMMNYFTWDYWNMGYYQRLDKHENTDRAIKFHIVLHSINMPLWVDSNPFTVPLAFDLGRGLDDDEKDHVWKFVFSHEIGHAFGIGENEFSMGAQTIMDMRQNPLLFYEPRPVDIFAAVRYYSSFKGG